MPNLASLHDGVKERERRLWAADWLPGMWISTNVGSR